MLVKIGGNHQPLALVSPSQQERERHQQLDFQPGLLEYAPEDCDSATNDLETAKIPTWACSQSGQKKQAIEAQELEGRKFQTRIRNFVCHIQYMHVTFFVSFEPIELDLGQEGGLSLQMMSGPPRGTSYVPGGAVPNRGSGQRSCGTSRHMHSHSSSSRCKRGVPAEDIELQKACNP